METPKKPSQPDVIGGREARYAAIHAVAATLLDRGASAADRTQALELAPSLAIPSPDEMREAAQIIFSQE